MLLCPVRDCHQALAREARRLVCPRSHSFDIARSGYLNLLQPQDSRSRQPGDTAAAVAARRRLHHLGITAPLLSAIHQTAALTSEDTVLDAGCGDGFYLGSLALQTGCQAHGTDISVPAIDAAARRYPQVEWVVANADRFIPYADKSFSLILSITARRNMAEFQRVLKDNGRLLIAIPAPDDLTEIRGPGRDRVARTIEEFVPHFKLVAQSRATTTAQLDAAAVEDVRLAIYRPMQAAPATAMQVTFSFDLLSFSSFSSFSQS